MDPRYGTGEVTAVRATPDLSKPISPDSTPVGNWLHELGDAAHQLAAATETFINARRNKEECEARYRDCLEQYAKERENANV